MKIIIAGSREVTDYNLILEAVRKSEFDISEVVSGNARGVDKLGERYATENNIDLKIFPADWDRYGKRAGYIRNSEMGEYADGLIAIWDGKSKGTKYMIDIIDNNKKLLYILMAKG